MIHIFSFFLIIGCTLYSMEDDLTVTTSSRELFTVFPEQLHVEHAKYMLRKKYLTGNEKNIFIEKLFEMSADSYLLTGFCQLNAMPHPYFVRLPVEIQVYILQWCCDHRPPDWFIGFLSEKSVADFKQRRFCFTDFDVRMNHKKIFAINIDWKIKDKKFNSANVVAVLKANELLPSNVEINEYQFANLCKEDINNRTIPFFIKPSCFGFPFNAMPLLPQELTEYYSGRLASKYRKEVVLAGKERNFDHYIRSCYYWNGNTEMFFVELMDETIRCNFEWEERNPNAPLPKNHYIKIFSGNNFQEIQTIHLPVTKKNGCEPFGNARCDIITVFNGIVVLYDKKYEKYTCFAPLQGIHFIGEAPTAYTLQGPLTHYPEMKVWDTLLMNVKDEIRKKIKGVIFKGISVLFLVFILFKIKSRYVDCPAK